MVEGRMKCSTPPPLTDEEISAALEGEIDAQTQLHLDNCTYCAARLVAAQQFERTLNQQLYRLNCPMPDELGDYIAGFLDESRRQKIAQHLLTCSLCQAEETHLRVFLNSPQQEQRPITSKPGLSPQRRFVSPLRLQPASEAAMTRGGLRGRPQEIELVAEAEDATVFLEIKNEGAGSRITGQVIAKDDISWAGALLELRQGDQIQAAVILQDDSEIICENVPPGEYELRMTGPEGQQLLLETLKVG
jgi:hypothetical protein